MGEKQDKIYYIAADSHAAAKNSPHLEIFRKKGIEVLLLSDRVDEWLTAHLMEYEGRKLQSVAKGELDLGDDEESDKELEEKSKSAEKLLKRMKEALAERYRTQRAGYGDAHAAPAERGRTRFTKLQTDPGNQSRSSYS